MVRRPTDQIADCVARSRRLCAFADSLSLREPNRRFAMLGSRITILLTALLAAGSLAVTGCTTKDKGGARPAAGGGSQSGAQPQAGAVLKLWHYEPPNSAMGIAWKQ